RMWVSSLPAANSRNIFTVLPDGSTGGTMVSFDSTNAATLRPYLQMFSGAGDPDAVALINAVRSQPLGAMISSTPAVLTPPSLDPPPDATYPAFITANVDRRALIFVGANDGMMHCFDARTGVELWAFIPFNLLPKLKALQSGQPVSLFNYFVD